MIYELRTYYIKPGKIEDIHNRFSKLTIDLFKKHGMNTLDFGKMQKVGTLFITYLNIKIWNQENRILVILRTIQSGLREKDSLN